MKKVGTNREFFSDFIVNAGIDEKIILQELLAAYKSMCHTFGSVQQIDHPSNPSELEPDDQEEKLKKRRLYVRQLFLSQGSFLENRKATYFDGDDQYYSQKIYL